MFSKTIHKLSSLIILCSVKRHYKAYTKTFHAFTVPILYGPSHWQATSIPLIYCRVWMHRSFLGLLLFRVKSWVVLNNAGLIGCVLQLISIKSLGDCHLSLGGRGAGAGATYLSQPLIRKHTFACFAKGRGHGGGADTISATEHDNCASVNCVGKKGHVLENSAETHGWALSKGYNEGPSVSGEKWDVQNLFSVVWV